MNALLDAHVLRRENREQLHSGGRSQDNRAAGFAPAFMDTETHTVYASRFADGRPAPFHLIDGLPADIVVERYAGGRVRAVKASIVSGFLLGGHFYRREEAARYMSALAD